MSSVYAKRRGAKIYAEVGYQIGVTNIWDSDDVTGHNNSFFFNFGVNF